MRSGSAHQAARIRSLTAVLLATSLLAGCYRVRSQLIPTPGPPNDVYQCVQLELGRAGYTIVDADRASRWLHAQRRIEHLLTAPDRAEIYATVIGDEGGGETHIQLTDNSHAEDDADRIRARCIEGNDASAPAPYSPPRTAT